MSKVYATAMVAGDRSWWWETRRVRHGTRRFWLVGFRVSSRPADGRVERGGAGREREVEVDHNLVVHLPDRRVGIMADAMG